MDIKSLVGEVMIYKGTGKPCMVLSEMDTGNPKNRIADDFVYGVEFEDGTRRDCRQTELEFFSNVDDRMRAERLFPN